MVKDTFCTGRSTFIHRMFANEGLGGEVSWHRETARWLAQVGGYYRQETGMGHQEQQADRARHGGLGRVTNAHTQQRYLDFLES